MQPVIDGARRTEVNYLPPLERYRGAVDGYMRKLLAQTDGIPARMVEYHLGFRDQEGRIIPNARSQGKGLRPALCLLTVDALGGEWEKAVPAAAALELFHNFTLIHDDIEDNDKTRHGKPTVWSLWGKEQATNAGDSAHLLSTKAVLGLKNDYPAETVVQTLDLLTEAGIQVANGQGLDMSFEGRQDVTVDEYLEMITGKTGILIETAIMMGAVLGSADQSTAAGLRQYGRSIGRAFQIVDDDLGIWGDAGKTGKSVCADIRAGKKSFPIVHAFANATGNIRSQLETIYENGVVSEDNISKVLQILEELQSREVTVAMSAEVTERAIEAIMETSINPDFKQDFIGLARQFSRRQK